MISFFLSEHNAYLVGGLLGLVVWLGIFLKRSDLRNEMIIMSIVGGLLAVFTEPYFLKDYWRAELISGFSLPFSDFLFGFSWGGVAATIYTIAFPGTRWNPVYKSHTVLFFIILFSFLLLFHLGVNFTSINSIYIAILMTVLSSTAGLLLRKDLFGIAFTSAFIFSIIYFAFFRGFILLLYPQLLIKFWLLHNLSGINIIGVPIEEILWAASCGFMFGPAYKFMNGLGKK